MAGSRLPCVLVNVMRGGPGLGSIGAAQGDYLQATKGHGHGDYHVPVLAPSSIGEAIELVRRRLRPRRALPHAGDDPRRRHPRPGDGAGPPGLPDPCPPGAGLGHRGRGGPRAPLAPVAQPARGGPRAPQPGAAGHLCRDRRAREPRWAGEHLEDAEVVLVAYGTAARVARTAVERAREQGLKAGLFRPITLWPFPAAALREAASGARAILVVELSAGQLVEDVRLAHGRRRPGAPPRPHGRHGPQPGRGRGGRPPRLVRARSRPGPPGLPVSTGEASDDRRCRRRPPSRAGRSTSGPRC